MTSGALATLESERAGLADTGRLCTLNVYIRRTPDARPFGGVALDHPCAGSISPKPHTRTLVGVYQISPAFAITITREGSNLSAQATGQEKLQLFAESTTEFFLKIVDAQVVFEKDATGKVTRLVLHQGGQSMPGVKK